MPSSSGRLSRLVKRADSDARFAAPNGQAPALPRNAAHGFTLLEILITLALIALLAGALIAGAGRMLNDQPTTPAEIFRRALTEARQYAIEKNVEVRLSFDAKNKAFTASTTDGSRSYPVAAGADLAIDFLAAQKGGSSVLIAGVLVETQTVPYVTFYPDGTCSPFRVQFRLGGDVSVMAIDPWTCAPVLETKAATG
jgi:general secretion pathway protein H